MSEPAQKCENQAIFKQKYTQKLLIAFKMVFYCCFSLGGNLDFLDFQKKFCNINSREEGEEYVKVFDSVTRTKSPNVYKSCPKMISLEKW